MENNKFNHFNLLYELYNKTNQLNCIFCQKPYLVSVRFNYL